mgnify:CR=1 FL=1
MSDIAARVKKIVIEHLGVEEAKVTENASFIDDLGADSLDTVELVMALEEEFECEKHDSIIFRQCQESGNFAFHTEEVRNLAETQGV